MKVFTLGTDHRPPYDLTRILVKHGIEVVFDIRQSPGAEENHLTRGGLEVLCSAQGISYVYLGNELGPTGANDRTPWLGSNPVQHWLEIIRRKAERRVCCLLGSERLPVGCRRRLLGDELAAHGIEVSHLLDERGSWAPPPSHARGARRLGRILPRRSRSGPGRHSR